MGGGELTWLISKPEVEIQWIPKINNLISKENFSIIIFFWLYKQFFLSMEKRLKTKCYVTILLCNILSVTFNVRIFKYKKV